MAYQIIQPPFTLKFREMSKKDLRDYYQWFMDIMPERVNELTNAVRQTVGFKPGNPTSRLLPWKRWGIGLASQVETRPRTDEELQEIKSRSSYPIDVSGKELTNRTFSLAMDTGMYLSQVFLQNCPSLRWNQEFGNKKFIDYGQPVLIEFTSAPFNPVRMMVTLAYSLISKTRTGQGLRELYDIWAKLVRPKM